MKIRRIILGGNIICGFAHSRDLIDVSSLVRAYHTPEKIFESLMLAEKCGINTILTHPSIADAINLYNAAETVAFMNEREEPWIAFKVMAAGSVPPREAFRYAFESGADYICAGMYDFQMVEDANIALETLAETQERPLRWSV